jgi:hypothetical protein
LRFRTFLIALSEVHALPLGVAGKKKWPFFRVFFSVAHTRRIIAHTPNKIAHTHCDFLGLLFSQNEI